MKLIFWSSLLILFWFWISQSETEANKPDVCHNELEPGELFCGDNSALEKLDVTEDIKDIEENFSCFLSPINILNCSWSFPTLQEGIHLSVHMGICDSNITVHPLRLLSEERVGSETMVLRDYKMLHVILHFTMSLHNTWTVYCYAYNIDQLEVLSPPPNISASVEDGNLLVTWGEPHSRVPFQPSCFEYQLDMGDQERPIDLNQQQSYTKLNADPTCTYRVRIRARINTNYCFGSRHWSDWSNTVVVEQAVYKLNTLVIISISLGIPMILLAVLLLVRYQRVSEVLFPPIPRPPPKYKNFLEKNDTFNIFHLAPAAKPEEEITEVEDTDQNPGKTF